MALCVISSNAIIVLRKGNWFLYLNCFLLWELVSVLKLLFAYMCDVFVYLCSVIHVHRERSGIVIA